MCVGQAKSYECRYEEQWTRLVGAVGMGLNMRCRRSRLLVGCLLIAALTGGVLRGMLGIERLSNRHLVYLFSAKGTINSSGNGDRGFSLSIWSSDSGDIWCLTLSTKGRPDIAAMLPAGAQFDKQRDSWTCYVNGVPVDLSGLLPRF